MSTSLYKLAHYLLTPSGAILCLTVIAILCCCKSKRFAFASLLLANVLFIICATPIFSKVLQIGYLAYFQDSQFVVNIREEPDRLKKHEAIVVAGWQKAFKADQLERKKFWSERLWLAFQWYQQHPAPIFIVSSQYPIPKSPDANEWPWAVLKLQEWGVASEHINNLSPQPSTRLAMQIAADEILSEQVKKVVLVAYQHRGARKFNELRAWLNRHPSASAVELYLSEVVHDHSEVSFTSLDAWVPDPKVFLNSTYILHEIFASIGYSLMRNWQS